MLTTRHRLQTPTGTGQRNGFHRHIDSVNRDETSSYPFEGKFIPDNRQVDLLPNDIIIRKSPKGSKGNPINHWQYAHVPEPGLQWIWSKSYLDTELLDFRDAVDEAQKGMTKVQKRRHPPLPAPSTRRRLAGTENSERPGTLPHSGNHPPRHRRQVADLGPRSV